LSDLVDRVDPGMIMSGIGEQPAAIHMNQFKLGGFTSGCVCLAPRQSMSLLHALIRQDFSHAEHVRRVFTQLEDLRNAINPIRVLHEAVELAEIAQTGPHYPNLSPHRYRTSGRHLESRHHAQTPRPRRPALREPYPRNYL
ncbi:MAG: hypothetical protein LR011_07750, partial [Verrucomicrobia bacterium]|nr:hypothetical protein [Verrucomicrobiota bacterium]